MPQSLSNTIIHFNFRYSSVENSTSEIDFGDKLKAAVAYQEYLNTDDKKNHEKAIEHLEKATANWSKLVNATKPVYKPVPIEHKGYKTESNLFHWSIVQEEVEAELEWLKSL